MTAEEHPQTQAEPVLALLATAHLVWSLLLLLAAVYVMTCPPSPPAAAGIRVPLGWGVWIPALLYLVAAAAFHGRLAFIGRRRLPMPRRLWRVSLVQMPLVACTAWSFLSGPLTLTNLLGLAPTVGVTLVASFLCVVLTAVTAIFARRLALPRSQADSVVCWLVAFLSLFTAMCFGFVEFSSVPV